MSVKMTFLGHAGFLFDDGTHQVAIDPWLTGNPVATMKPADVKVGHIVVTHGHGDHFGDVEAIAKENSATVYCAYEVMEYLNEKGYEKVQPGNTGGKLVGDFGWVAFTQAFHSSSFNGRYMGQPMGAVLHMGGRTIYHCGDTGIFGDMKLLGEIYKPDVALIPVGDRFTMGPELGKMAAEMIGAKVAIPIHYKTFPGMLADDISAFAPAGIEVRPLAPGESWTCA
ncbi:MAG TPA: metal-dependent hydrolase [Phycisphaerae bacterium]|nr:metal-dependent hydrolase [Phycisphaerae bacterium]HRW55873.1 metal-dependent hydrolase [Phycisphaerae bacterium]